MPMNDISKFGLMSGLGSLGSGVAGLFGGGSNPYDKASQYYNQIPETLRPYFEPYINQGMNTGNQLNQQYGQLTGNLPALQSTYDQLIHDPGSVMSRIGQGYQQSPGFQWQLNQGMNAANNAAAAGGMAGSPQHQQKAAQMAEGLANQDYWNYMNKGLGLYDTGLGSKQGLYNTGVQGMQNVYNTGYNAADSLAGGLAANLMNQGNLAFAGQAAQNQNQGASWGNIFSGLAGLSFL